MLLAYLCWAVRATLRCIDMVGISPHDLSLDRASPQFQCLHDLCEVSSTLSTTIHRIATTRRVIAATVDDPRASIDVRLVVEVHSGINPLFEVVHVVPPILVIVGLDRVQPVEEACDPLQSWRRVGLTDRLGILAEIDVWVEHTAALVVPTPAQVVVELAEVADAGGLDDTPAPPAAPLDIGAACAVEHRSRRVRAASSATPVPSSSFDTFVVAARPTFRDIAVVLQKSLVVHHIRKRCFIAIATLLWAPGAPPVPLIRLGHNRLGCTEELRGCTIPYSLSVGTQHHVGVRVACHFPSSFGIILRRALVILVGLPTLSTGIACSVGLASELLRHSRVAPVVLVTSVVHDRLLHALAKEASEIDEAILEVVALTYKQRLVADAGLCHDLDPRNHVLPGVECGGSPLKVGHLIQEDA